MRRQSVAVFLCALFGLTGGGPLFGQTPDHGVLWVLVEGGPEGDFRLSATEVTFAQFDAFCTATDREKPKDVFGRGSQPVVNVSFDDAVAYCEWLSEQMGETVRLPNAGEWVFAARGGSRSAKFVYSGSNEAADVAWFIDNANGRAHEVGTKKPNELGLFDMSGNVWEWCDTYSIRSGGNWAYGGAWNLHDLHARVPTRIVLQGEDRRNDLGFRVVMEP